MLKTQALDAIKKVRDMYAANPQSWTQKAFACDQHGAQLQENDPKACRFCIVGGLYRFNSDTKVVNYAVCCILQRHHGSIIDIVLWNDAPERTVNDVIAALDRTIAAEAA